MLHCANVSAFLAKRASKADTRVTPHLSTGVYFDHVVTSGACACQQPCPPAPPQPAPPWGSGGEMFEVGGTFFMILIIAAAVVGVGCCVCIGVALYCCLRSGKGKKSGKVDGSPAVAPKKEKKGKGSKTSQTV